jgi:hypothetical protein
VPFVVIQILMVGLIIAFPALVTSGLTKETTLDPDKVFQQLQRQPRESGAPGAGPAASGVPAADEKEDPMKGFMESLRKDEQKKP